MFKFNIAAIKEGHSTLVGDIAPRDIGLEKEFNQAIHILYDMNKVGPEVFITATLETTLDLQCDVCLDSFLFEVTDKVSVILTSDSDLGEREDDVYLVADATTEVDISESIRQSLLLDIPFKKKCSELCKGLCPTCGANLNNGPCNCKQDKTDPRWDALKEIKFE